MESRHYFISYIFLFITLSLALTGCKRDFQGSLDFRSNPQRVNYTFAKMFDVADKENEQGLAFGNQTFFVAFDIGNGQARIVQYSNSGTELKRSVALPLGHAAEVAYRQANGDLYVTDGSLSGGSRWVREVNMNLPTPAITRTINFSGLGKIAMVAVDNSIDRLVVLTEPAPGSFTVATADFNGIIFNKFNYTPKPSSYNQGIEVINNDILFYTSKKDKKSNNITVYSLTGTKLYSIPVPIANEGEGLSVDETKRTVYIGTHRPNRIYKMSPALPNPALL